MSDVSSPPPPSAAETGLAPGATGVPAAIDASCRLPLVVLFLCAAVWLVIGSAFTLIASIKLHEPGFLADSAWLTYGRVDRSEEHTAEVQSRQNLTSSPTRRSADLVWLVIGSAFTLIASIKFHAPGFLADSAWLTYGRVH